MITSHKPFFKTPPLSPLKTYFVMSWLHILLVVFAKDFTNSVHCQYAFRRPQFSMLKTAVMMIGEFEFTSVYYGIGEVDTATAPTSEIHSVSSGQLTIHSPHNANLRHLILLNLFI